jgi:hypothetical protein
MGLELAILISFDSTYDPRYMSLCLTERRVELTSSRFQSGSMRITCHSVPVYHFDRGVGDWPSIPNQPEAWHVFWEGGCSE